MQPEETTATNLARLTEREKECLRRRLLPQTAKEMAADLGISAHAVEKRLKMARTKLGVPTSLAAARVLAGIEGYQRLVPQNPDLPNQLRLDDHHALAKPATRSLRLYIVGGFGMIAITLLFAFVTQTTGLSSASTAAPMLENGHPIASRKVDWNDAQEFDKEAFKCFDKDSSGYLDPPEVSALEPRDSSREKTLSPAPALGQRDLAGQRKWMLKLDTNHDGKVSEQEYMSYMLPWTLLSGVPADWHSKI